LSLSNWSAFTSLAFFGKRQLEQHLILARQAQMHTLKISPTCVWHFAAPWALLILIFN
jgi:hypothetical protein